MGLNQKVKRRTLVQLSPKNYETRKMEKHPNQVSSPDTTASVMSCVMSLIIVTAVCGVSVACRASSEVCRAPEERRAWQHTALHLQEHSGTKSSLSDETGKAV